MCENDIGYFDADCPYDKRTYRFASQIRHAKTGCGPFSVGIAKELMSGHALDQKEWNRLLAIDGIESGGMQVEQLLPLLRDAPTTGFRLIDRLRLDTMCRATIARPCIVSWKFLAPYGGVGGHFNVCIGPTAANSRVLVILDPAFGLNYVYLPDRDGPYDDAAIAYHPMIRLSGEDPGTAEKPADAVLEVWDQTHLQSSLIECERIEH